MIFQSMDRRDFLKTLGAMCTAFLLGWLKRFLGNKGPGGSQSLKEAKHYSRADDLLG